MNDSIPHSHFQDGDIPSTSGIYKITCIANKKIYIGSAVNLRRRRREHFSTLQRNIHGNPILQHAWNKYGEQAFTFEVLELVLSICLTAREQYWFQKLKPFGRKGFNIAREAGSNVGNKGWTGHKHTPESIEKIRQATLGKKRTPESRERMRQVHLGQKRSLESIEKQKQSHTGLKRTPETIERIRQSKLGNTYGRGSKHTPEAIEKMRQAKLNQSPETRKKISDAMRGRKPSPQTIEAVKRANLRRKQEKESRENT